MPNLVVIYVKLQKTPSLYRFLNDFRPLSCQTENPGSETAGLNRWLFLIGLKIEGCLNLKWRRNWNHIFRVERTTGLRVCLEGLVGIGEVSKACSDDDLHEMDSNLHQSGSATVNQKEVL